MVSNDMFAKCLSSISLGKRRGEKLKNSSGHVQSQMGGHVVVLSPIDV